MAETGSTLPIQSRKACVVYDAASGRMRHVHRVTTFVGGREPTLDAIAADALRAVRALPDPPAGDLQVLHVGHDAVEAGKRYRVDLQRMVLVADAQ